MITTKCPHCGHTLRIPDKYAGKRGRCKHCGRLLTVSTTETERESRPSPSGQFQEPADLGSIQIDLHPSASRESGTAQSHVARRQTSAITTLLLVAGWIVYLGPATLWLLLLTGQLEDIDPIAAISYTCVSALIAGLAVLIDLLIHKVSPSSALILAVIIMFPLTWLVLFPVHLIFRDNLIEDECEALTRPSPTGLGCMIACVFVLSPLLTMKVIGFSWMQSFVGTPTAGDAFFQLLPLNELILIGILFYFFGMALVAFLTDRWPRGWHARGWHERGGREP